MLFAQGVIAVVQPRGSFLHQPLQARHMFSLAFYPEEELDFGNAVISNKDNQEGHHYHDQDDLNTRGLAKEKGNNVRLLISGTMP